MAIPTEPPRPPPPREAPRPGDPAAQLLDAARGFAGLFWGLLASLLLFPGELDIQLSPRLRIPVYPAAMIAIYCGLSRLNRAGPLRPRWLRHVQEARGMLLLLFYFVPFVLWWKQAPRQPFLLGNMAAFVVVAAGLLASSLRLCEAAGELFGRRLFRAEVRLCRWLVLLVAAPTASAFLTGAWLAASCPDALWFGGLTVRWVFWLCVLGLLPFTLTLAAIWKAKELLFAAAGTPPVVGGAAAEDHGKQVTSSRA